MAFFNPQLGLTIIPVNNVSSSRIITLPPASTTQGTYYVIKNLYESQSTIVISTTGLDTLSRQTASVTTRYGAWILANNGITNWFGIDSYLNTLTIVNTNSLLPFAPMSVSLGFVGSTLTATWTPSPNAVSYTVSFYATLTASSSGGTLLQTTTTTDLFYTVTQSINDLVVSGSVPGGATQIFSYTGTNQTFIVPADVSSLTISLSGAGGGSGNNQTSNGGPGALLSGTLTVTPGQTLTLIVGQGGMSNRGSTTGGTASYGGGGAGGSCLTGPVAGAGAGGGRSAIQNNSGVDLVSAGGGGGGGVGGIAGSGGLVGTSGGGSSDGGGGTQTVGGSGGSGTDTGTSGTGPASSSLTRQGGTGGSASSSFYSGGGGGGGYYGGGGGGSSGGGGGGSSLAPSGTSVVTGGGGAGGSSTTTNGDGVNGSITISVLIPTYSQSLTTFTNINYYYATVTANNANGSQTITTSPPIKPILTVAAPTGLALTFATNALTLTWNAVIYAVSYNVNFFQISSPIYLINLTSFSRANMNLVGSAFFNLGQIILTANIGNEAAAAWYTAKVPLLNKFTTVFNVSFESTLADGAAFVIQNINNTTAIGNPGGSLGFGGIGANSLAITLKTYNNLNGTPGIFSTGVLTNGTDSTGLGASGNLNTSLGLTSGGTWNFTVTVLWDGTNLNYTIFNTDNGLRFTSNAPYNVPSIVGDTSAYIGFTAGTGGAREFTFLKSWQYFIDSGGLTTPTLVQSVNTTNTSASTSITLKTNTYYIASVQSLNTNILSAFTSYQLPLLAQVTPTQVDTLSVTVFVSDVRVICRWTPSANAISYNVAFYSNTSATTTGGTLIETVSNTTGIEQTRTTLIIATYYYATVTAVNQYGSSAATTSINVVRLVISPFAPQNVIVTVSGYYAICTWSGQGIYATSYTITFYQNTTASNTGGTPFEVNPLNFGTSQTSVNILANGYYIYAIVTAVTQFNTASTTSPITALTDFSPRNISISLSGFYAVVTWTPAVANTPSFTVIYYYNTTPTRSGGIAFETATLVTGTTRTSTNIVPNGYYIYATVTSVNGIVTATGTSSNTTSLTNFSPTDPTNLTLVSSGLLFTISWVSFYSTSYTVVLYNNGTTNSVTGGSIAQTLTGVTGTSTTSSVTLVNGNFYYFTVAGFSSVNNRSTATIKSSAATQALLNLQNLVLTVSNTTGVASLSWTPITGGNYTYVLYSATANNYTSGSVYAYGTTSSSSLTINTYSPIYYYFTVIGTISGASLLLTTSSIVLSSYTAPSGPSAMSGLIIWNDASILTGTTGTTVNGWTNLAGGTTYITTTTGTLSVAGRNSKNTILITSGQTWTISTQPNLASYSMFWSGRQTGSSNQRVLQSTSNNQLFGYWGGQKKVLYIDGNPNILSNTNSDTVWDTMSHTRIVNGAYTMNWDGNVIYTGAGSAGTNLTGLAINAGAYAENSSVEVGEIILFNVVLTTTDIQTLEGYLAWKWGSQANLPAGHPYKSAAPNSAPAAVTNPYIITATNVATMTWSAFSGATGYTWVLFTTTNTSFTGTVVSTGTVSSSTLTATYTGLTLNNYYYFGVYATTASTPSAYGSSALSLYNNGVPTGGSITLNAFTVATGGSVIITGLAMNATAYALYISTTTSIANAVFAYTSILNTFNFTGATQSYVVPSTISVIGTYVSAAGGGGGSSAGKGALVTGTATVTPNSTLTIYVGGTAPTVLNAASPGGWPGGGTAQGGEQGGGGGGYSAVANAAGSTYFVIAGAGGGGTGYGGTGGNGGLNGNSGGTVNGNNPATGGTQTAGGTGINGSGNGSYLQGGFAAGAVYDGGGGGGGYYGGGGGPGGGAGALLGGGGGGSSLTTAPGFTLFSVVTGGGATFSTNGQVILSTPTNNPTNYTVNQSISFTATLAANTAYYAILVPSNSFGNGTAVVSSSQTTPNVPVGGSIVLNSGLTTSGGSVTITAATGATNYTVYISTTTSSANSVYSFTTTTTGSAVAFSTTLSSNTTYYAVLLPSNAAGNGTFSNSGGVTTPSALYSFTNVTFNTGGATIRNGPILSQAIAGMTGTPAPSTWNSNTAYFNMTTQGYQLWTVPQTRTYTITCAGSATANVNSGFGYGAIIQTTVNLTQGQKIQIVCGQKGGIGTGSSSGGGGGSFVASGTTPATGVCLVAAGGGGGFLTSGVGVASQNGTINTNGNTATGSPIGAGGTNGGGGTGASGGWGGGGGGFTGNGGASSGTANSGGLSFINGCTGGAGNSAVGGGFGGGGGTDGNTGGGGGGGGYSGGGGSGQNTAGGTGGGGGSFPAGATNIGLNSGPGYVTIA